MENWFLEEYLIYFKSELMLNSKFSHVANSLIRSHLAFTTHSREMFEMVKCLKVFCFRPNSTLHNKIKVGDLICNILQIHQNGNILNLSKVKSTRPDMLEPPDWATLVNSWFLLKTLKFHTDLQMAFAQTFSCWCIKQSGQFTSKQRLNIPNICPKFKDWVRTLKCCEMRENVFKLVTRCF